MNDAIRVHMTPAVWTIGQGTSLATARSVMNERKIRHLPVLHGGRLVGLVCGIFTTVDALRAIDALLSTPRVRKAVRTSSPAARNRRNQSGAHDAHGVGL